MLTQDELKTVVKYDPETGLFTNIKNRGGLLEGYVYKNTDALGYVTFKINKKTYKAHRLAFLYMEGYIPDCVDHINCIRNDNRWCNLRPVTRTQNCQNASMRHDNKTGIKGVAWHKRDKCYQARCRVNGEERWVGRFDSLEDAENAIRIFREKHHGDYARHE